MKTIFIASLLILYSSIIYSQNDYNLLSLKVDSILEKFNNSPGCVIGIIEDGIFVHKKGYGFANLEYNIPNTSSTVFHIASVSKQFTGFAIHLLEQEGKLSLSDDIRKYLPDMPYYGDTIHIYNLLNHTSGIRDQWELLIAAGWSMDDLITQKQVLDIIKSQDHLNFKPGTIERYSNSNYTLLAAIIEKICGKTFAEYTREKIFEPLGMSNTFFLDNNDLIIKNRAYSYRPDGKQKYKTEQLNFATPGATNLQTNLDDFAKWDRNFYTMELGGKQLMNEYLTLGKLNDGTELDYASGLKIRYYKGLRVLMHGGADAGYGSFYITIPEKKLSLIFFSNYGDIGKYINIFEILDMYIEGDITFKKNNRFKPINNTVHSNDDYLGTYIDNSEFVYKIIKEDSILVLQYRNNYKLELSYISKDSLFAESLVSLITFTRNDNNEITGFSMNYNNYYKKVINKKLSIEELQDYSGDYFSYEINTIKQIEYKSNFLFFKGRNVSMDPLYFKDKDIFYVTCADEFQRQLSEVKFDRNERGEIIGFYINTPMVKELYFKKTKKILYYD